MKIITVFDELSGKLVEIDKDTVISEKELSSDPWLVEVEFPNHRTVRLKEFAVRTYRNA